MGLYSQSSGSSFIHAIRHLSSSNGHSAVKMSCHLLCHQHNHFSLLFHHLMFWGLFSSTSYFRRENKKREGNDRLTVVNNCNPNRKRTNPVNQGPGEKWICAMSSLSDRPHGLSFCELPTHSVSLGWVRFCWGFWFKSWGIDRKDNLHHKQQDLVS